MIYVTLHHGAMRRQTALLLIALVATACTSAPPPDAPVLTPAPSATAPPGLGSSEGPYAPDAPIPSDPDELAGVIVDVTRELYASIDEWVASGGTASWPPPRALQLRALYQQRLTRGLAGSSGLAAKVIPELPDDVRAEVEANVAAAAALLSNLRPPSREIVLRTGPPRPADELLGYYREAEERFGVDWEVLAAINLVETRFGRVRSPSWAGARGPMQFMPATWKGYGMGGDVRDPHDAILGAANYLAARGAPEDYRAALYAYNPLRTYVRAIRLYARQIMRDPRSFYAYYNWQVFVIRPDGSFERLTGPGIRELYGLAEPRPTLLEKLRVRSSSALARHRQTHKVQSLEGVTQGWAILLAQDVGADLDHIVRPDA